MLPQYCFFTDTLNGVRQAAPRLAASWQVCVPCHSHAYQMCGSVPLLRPSTHHQESHRQAYHCCSGNTSLIHHISRYMDQSSTLIKTGMINSGLAKQILRFLITPESYFLYTCNFCFQDNVMIATQATLTRSVAAHDSMKPETVLCRECFSQTSGGPQVHFMVQFCQSLLSSA